MCDGTSARGRGAGELFPIEPVKAPRKGCRCRLPVPERSCRSWRQVRADGSELIREARGTFVRSIGLLREC